MSERIYLEGSEEVGRAGAAIRAAVFNMQGAASTIDSSIAALIQHQAQMIERFENVVEKLISAFQGSGLFQLDATSIEGSRTGRIHNTSGNVTEVERGRVPPVGLEPVVGKSRFEDETA